MPPARTDKTGEKTVTAKTPAFSGREEPSATAKCPDGYLCTGGSVDVPEGAVVTASRPADEGDGWYGSFAGGPSGGVGVVKAVCELDGKASPSGP